MSGDTGSSRVVWVIQGNTERKKEDLGFGQARRVKGVGNSFAHWESMVLDRIRSLRCLFFF